jgi:prepilin-type N-terminal cleavage/methylation domain-containing protein
MRKAFTLIELLVVIAIIAILAAILFPVFAQAKAAAKATAALSNVKQASLGVIMYGADAEDNFPLATLWNTGSDQLTYGSGLAFSTWAWVVQPYVKSSDLFMDPLATPNTRRAAGQRNFDTYYVQFGINHTYLSPDFNPGTAGKQESRSQTSFAQPAGTVMLTSKWAEASNKSGFDYGTGFPGGVLAAAVSEAPSCYTIPQWCLAGWGSGGFFENTLLLTKSEGAATGGNALRASDGTIVAWVDGHATKSKPGFLAQGTNWTPTAPEGVNVTDSSKYLWDNE